MWALGNHITLSLWSIPEPVIIYSVLLIRPQPLPMSLFLLNICTVLSLSLYFQSLFCLCHSSSLSSISHSHTHSVGYYVLLLSLVCLWSLDIFLVSSLFFPCSLTLCPQARHSSTFPPPQLCCASPVNMFILAFLLLPSFFALNHMCACCQRGSIDSTLGWQAR